MRMLVKVRFRSKGFQKIAGGGRRAPSFVDASSEARATIEGDISVGIKDDESALGFVTIIWWPFKEHTGAGDVVAAFFELAIVLFSLNLVFEKTIEEDIIERRAG
jgi:hypothetical protein